MLGRSLGNYGVVSKIGEGGMGVVYLARHVTLGRRAAIKVLRPALSSDQDIVSRFFKEARAATAVRNPGIVEVYDFGFLEDCTAYIIMEYLDGESLATRLRRGCPPLAVTLTIIRAIARALQAAHDEGIVHRDLKPDNVFLVPDSELPSGERVKLLDFGIAKLTYEVGAAGHTQTGTIMGTPTYMSPEQCRGAGTVDQRADLYSLGCVAYEMLCGRPPFIAEGPGDVLARHLCCEPSPLRSHRPDIPVEIEEIVLRLLKKEPRDRYRAATELVQAIDQFAATTLREEPRSERTASDCVTTLPMVNEKTTLNGAASSRAIPNETRGPRLVVVAVAVTAALLVVIIFFVRGTRDDATRSNAATGALRTEPMEPQVPSVPPSSGAPLSSTAPATSSPPPPSAAPATSAALPPSATPATPSPPPPSAAPATSAAPPPSATPGTPTAPGDDSPPFLPGRRAPGNPSHPGGSGDDLLVTTQHNSPGPFTGPEVTKPDDPTTTMHTSESPKQSRTSKATSSTRSVDSAPTTGGKAHGATEAIEIATSTHSTGAKPSKPPSGPGPTGSFDTECTSASFAQVLDAKTPSPAAVKGAKNLLMRCKPLMDPEQWEDIHRRLIEKY